MYIDKKSGDKLYQASLNYLIDQDYYKGDPDGGYTSFFDRSFISNNLVEERDKLEKKSVQS